MSAEFLTGRRGFWRVELQKIIGALILLLCSVGYGFIRIREERRAAAEVEAFAGLIRTVRENIAHYMKPLPEIFASCSGGILEENGFLPLCREKGIRAAWREVPMKLTPKLRTVTEDFVSRIGGGYREDELHLCDYTLEQFEKAEKEMRTELGNREKLYRTIPPLLALSAVLLFI